MVGLVRNPANLSCRGYGGGHLEVALRVMREESSIASFRSIPEDSLGVTEEYFSPLSHTDLSKHTALRAKRKRKDERDL